MGKRSRHSTSLQDAISEAAKKKKPQQFHPQANVFGRGLVLPGYNYLGPGNDLSSGRPTDPDDYIAQDHDYDYRDLEDAGINPYITYSEADEVARRRFGYGYGGNLGKAAFTKKKLLAEAGILAKTKFKKRHHFMLKQQSDPRFHFVNNVAKPTNQQLTNSSNVVVDKKQLDKLDPKKPAMPAGGTTPGQRANQPNQGQPKKPKGIHFLICHV